ncbi:cyclase family protein [Agromyces sp. H66]|uniref:cyclase family protein n=1 Tax=Agromyces sp. H66 TaxID=2529859 RepID=UPI0010AAE844|nr:cyclase family protein [Agromyces sp. H66]
MPDESTMTHGALSRLTNEHVRDAAALVRTGRVYDLGQELSERVPQGAPGAFTPFSFTWRTTPEECVRAGHAHEFAAETITGALHVSTHIDGLAHVSANGRIFGGAAVGDVRRDRGFSVHGMERVPPIVGRALVLDVAGVLGRDPLPDGYEVTVDDIRRVLDATELSIRFGDIVCIRTGKSRQYLSDPDAYQAAQPGIGPDAAIWLHEQGMAVLGTDTTGTEPLPFPDESHTTHKAMLVDRGVHLIENLTLEEVADDEVAVGMLVCLPLKITGATGSWVRPVLMC